MSFYNYNYNYNCTIHQTIFTTMTQPTTQPQQPQVPLVQIIVEPPAQLAHYSPPPVVTTISTQVPQAGLILAPKLKRPRLSEDSNFNGSSTMDTPLMPEDDDYHYLMSLHPHMKQLTSAQKLRIRGKIQNLIFKELDKNDLEESK
ncbi:uncharacterized protein [Drosophila bipectinata]|uniref:uncharacterized protein n=1 Tax=Drosophila bipectinata TaxID=42026 RepID=UPI0038B28AA6